MNVKTLDNGELEDIVIGAGLLGAGGGGSPDVGMRIVKRIVETGRKVQLIKPEEVPDNAKVVVVFAMGSPEVLLNGEWEEEDLLALEALERHTDERISFIVPFETGSFNSLIPMYTATMKGLPIIDGDGAGRAVPELSQTMYCINNVPIAPLSLADSKGDYAILYPANVHMAEKMARAITTTFGMVAGVACHFMMGKQLKESVVPGTLTKAEEVGKNIIEAINSGRDPIKAVIGATGGFEIARGKIKSKTAEVNGSFDFGRITLDDIAVDYKNENIIGWRGDKPIGMAPDLICWMKADGMPLTNADIEEGMEVAVIGKRCHPKCIELGGFETFKPILGKLGYEGDYIPVDELN